MRVGCNNLLMNNLKGSQKTRWISYEWRCDSQNKMTSDFSNAAEAVSTVTDVAKKVIMVHPSEMLGSNKALKMENKAGTFTALL